jgi:transcriptional regulator with XRE-family HTH domain
MQMSSKKIRNLQMERVLSQSTELKVSEVLDRMKVACGLKTDAQLAEHVGVSNKTVSSWRARNSLPIESVIQIADETDKRIEHFLFGEEEKRPATDFNFSDMRMRDFEIAGESIFVSLLQRYAGEELAFMDEAEVKKQGEGLGIFIMGNLALIRQERRALLDSGKLDETTFDEYVRKSFRYDLPHMVRASENRQKKREKGPQ